MTEGTEQLTKMQADAAPPEAPAQKELALAEFTPGVTDMWAVGAEKGYEHLMKVADVFSHSGLVPDRYRCTCRKRGEDCDCGATNDCAIVIAMALKHRADILGFMQKVYVVYGTPGMESQLAVALANTSGVWTAPIAYKMTGTEGEMDRKCTAWAIDRKSMERCERSCSMEDANKSGWTKPVKLKGGGTMPSKWVTMSEDMLRYRAAMKLMRTYHPEILLGMNTVDELHEIGPRDIEIQVLDERKQAIAAKVGAAQRQIAAPRTEEDEKPISEVMADSAKVVETEPAPAAKEPPAANGKQESLLEQPKTEASEPHSSSLSIEDLLAADMSAMNDGQMREHRQAVVAHYRDLCEGAGESPKDPTTTRTSTLVGECKRLLEVLKQR